MLARMDLQSILEDALLLLAPYDSPFCIPEYPQVQRAARRLLRQGLLERNPCSNFQVRRTPSGDIAFHFRVTQPRRRARYI